MLRLDETGSKRRYDRRLSMRQVAERRDRRDDRGMRELDDPLEPSQACRLRCRLPRQECLRHARAGG